MAGKASTKRVRDPAKTAAARVKAVRKTPVKFTPEVAEELLERLSSGERWGDFAATERMPGYAAPYGWAKRDKEFRAAFELAKRVGADMRADHALSVAETSTKETLPVDRFHVGTLKWHVDRDTKLYGPMPDEPDLGAGRRLMVYVRRFERYIDENGKPQVREVTTPPRGAQVAG